MSEDIQQDGPVHHSIEQGHRQRSVAEVLTPGIEFDVCLTGTVDDDAFKSKSPELKADTARVTEEIDAQGDVDPARGKTVLAMFDCSQKAAEDWRGSNTTARRQILDSICLNRQVHDVTLVTTKRKPFDFFVARLDLKNSRGDRTSIELFSASFGDWTKSQIAIANALAS